MDIHYCLFEFLPCLEDDLKPVLLVSSGFTFFLSFFVLSDSSGEAAAGLFNGSESLEKSLEQGGLEAVLVESESEPESSETTRLLGQELSVVVTPSSAGLSGSLR